MLQLTPQSRIFIALAAVDFRKGIDGLAAVCRRAFSQNPLDGAIYVFRNRTGTTLKVLYYDGQGYWLSSKRQNTPPAEKRGGQITIIDPAHPLYGHPVTLLRIHSARSNARLVVQLPDGRVRWIPRAITDLDPAPPGPPPIALITAPTLLPLARLVCAMVSAQEDSHYDSTDRSLVTETGSPADAFLAPELMDGAGSDHPPATGPLFVRLDPAVPGRRGHGGPGEAP